MDHPGGTALARGAVGNRHRNLLILGLVFSGWILITSSLRLPSQISLRLNISANLVMPLAQAMLLPERNSFKVQSRYMTGQFTMQITAALVIGLIMAFPYVFWEIWQFIKPGLRLTEKKSFEGRGVLGFVLVFAGVSFGNYFALPYFDLVFSSYAERFDRKQVRHHQLCANHCGVGVPAVACFFSCRWLLMYLQK